MLIYNTTFHVDDKVHDNFLIWIKESYIPAILQNNILKNPRLSKVLSHHDEGVVYSMQWEVENSSELHHWHMAQGMKFNDEILKIFNHTVTWFPTLMEVIE